MTNPTDLYNQIKTFIFGIMLYLHIEKELLLILFSVIMINMIAGGLKAIFLEEMKFSIAIWWAGLLKKSLLLIIIMLLGLLSRGMGFQDFKIMVTIVMKAMLLSEAIKVMNNVRSIYDKKEYKSSDFISLLIEKITEFIGFKMKKILEFFGNEKK